MLTERVAWAIETIKRDQGINDKALAKMLGTNKDTLAAYRQKKGLLKGVVIERLVNLYDFSPSWLFQGLGEPFPGARKQYPEACGPIEPEPVHLDPHTFSFIPKYRTRLSGGHGSFETSTEIENYCAFRTEWLKKRWNSSRLALFEVTGDSMAPLIQHHDMVLVDMSKNSIEDIIDGKIYAFSEDHVVRIKRLVRKGSELWAISDNKTESPDSRIDLESGTFNLIGKVAWIGHEVR